MLVGFWDRISKQAALDDILATESRARTAQERVAQAVELCLVILLNFLSPRFGMYSICCPQLK